MAHGQSIYHPFLAIGLKVPFFAVFSVFYWVLASGMIVLTI